MLAKFLAQVKQYLTIESLQRSASILGRELFRKPLYLITHPIDGFDAFSREKTSKGWVANVYLILMIFTQVIAYNANGFLVNKNNPRDFNLFMSIILIVFPVVIVVIANWATTALMDGKGTMTQIYRVICYSFFPYVWMGLLATLISNVITLDEVVFFTFFQGLGAFFMGFMLFFGLLGIHEYGLFKTILMLLFTVVAIAFILFIMLLFLSLIQQIWAFLSSVIDEFVRRFL